MVPMPRRYAATALGLAGAAVLVGALAVGVWPEPDGSGPSTGQSTGPSTDAGSSTVASSSTTAPAPRSFTLVAAGDVLLHPPLWEQAAADAVAAGAGGHDFRPLLAGVKPLVGGADLAVCHLETPVAAPGEAPSGYPSFSVPPEIVPALADAGFDACTTASNHTFDRGAAGIDRTLAALDAAGIAHTGSARTPEEAATTTLLPAGGADVALLSYTFGFNGVPAPGGESWRSNPIDEARIRADAAAARAGGADVVVVALHWGDEYDPTPTTTQRSLGPALVRSPDVDLVIGHHAHVVQPVEHVDGEWVVYGLGNFVAHHGTTRPPNQEGLLMRFTFTEGPAGWRATSAEYATLLVTRPDPVRLLDVGAVLASGAAASADPARLQEAWDRTAAVVGSLGAVDAGLRPIGRGR